MAWHMGYPLSVSLFTSHYIDRLLWPQPQTLQQLGWYRSKGNIPAERNMLCPTSASSQDTSPSSTSTYSNGPTSSAIDTSSAEDKASNGNIISSEATKKSEDNTFSKSMLGALRAYCLGLIKTCDFVTRRISSEHYYEVSTPIMMCLVRSRAYQPALSYLPEQYCYLFTGKIS